MKLIFNLPPNQTGLTTLIEFFNFNLKFKNFMIHDTKFNKFSQGIFLEKHISTLKIQFRPTFFHKEKSTQSTFTLNFI